VYKVKAYYVKMSIAGILSLFWSADYWYDTANGKFIKFKGTQGPGTQEAVVELIQ